MSAIRKIVQSGGVESTTAEEQETEFCSMDDDCISHILNWLSIKELCMVKVTCKRLYLLTNEHYRRTYISRRSKSSYFKYFRSIDKHGLMEGHSVSRICDKQIKPNMKYIFIRWYCTYTRP